MKRIAPFLLLIVMFSFACSQPGDNESKTTTNSEDTAEQQTDSVENQQADSQNGNQINRVKPEKKGKVVARVNGVPIYENEIKGTSLNSAITDEILYQEGLKRGLDKEYEDKVLDYQMSIVVRGMKSRILEELPPEKVVSDEEIEEYYQANKDKFTNLKLEEINFSDKEKADEIKKLAGEGKELKEIEGQYPDSDVKFKDIGYNRSLTGYFETKEVGSVTDVIEKKDGTYSILKIVEVSEMPFQQIKRQLGVTVEARRKTRAYDEFARKVAEENNVEIEIIEESN